MEKQILEIGKVVNTHGIRGEIKIQPWCDDPLMFNELEYIFIGDEKYKLSRVRLHKSCLIVLLDGINDINVAEKLKNKTVTVNRSDLGVLPEGTYYIADIIGLKVIDEKDSEIGVISDVISTGSNDVYQVSRENKKDVLIPVIEDVVNEVNIDGGYVSVTLMKGLMDDEV